MDKEKVQYFKNKLLEEKVEQNKHLNSREEEAMDSQKNELSSYDNHPADIGTEVYMMEQEQGYTDQIKETIKKIDYSLEEIEKGNYGICDNCHKEIQEERLELIPYTRTCFKCSNVEEDVDEEVADSEQKYESLNYMSFDLKSNKDKDNVGYDSEDTLQDIMQDNIVPKDPSYSTGDNIGIMDEEYGDEFDISEDVEKISEEYYKKTLE